MSVAVRPGRLPRVGLTADGRQQPREGLVGRARGATPTPGVSPRARPLQAPVGAARVYARLGRDVRRAVGATNVAPLPEGAHRKKNIFFLHASREEKKYFFFSDVQSDENKK